MQITRAGDYGLQGMLYLASLPERKEAFVSQIAKAQKIPTCFLAKIFQNLSKAGLVHSYRGAKGGYVLARPADEITLLDIIQGVEGPIQISLCTKGNGACSKSKKCPIHPIILEAQDIIKDTFNKYTLADLIESNHK